MKALAVAVVVQLQTLLLLQSMGTPCSQLSPGPSPRKYRILPKPISIFTVIFVSRLAEAFALVFVAAFLAGLFLATVFLVAAFLATVFLTAALVVSFFMVGFLVQSD